MRSEVNETTIAGVALLLMAGAVTGCAQTHLTFQKPGVAEADLQRDQNECFSKSLSDEGGRILLPRVDQDALIRCMEARGYAVSSK